MFSVMFLSALSTFSKFFFFVNIVLPPQRQGFNLKTKHQHLGSYVFVLGQVFNSCLFYFC